MVAAHNVQCVKLQSGRAARPQYRVSLSRQYTSVGALEVLVMFLLRYRLTL